MNTLTTTHDTHSETGAVLTTHTYGPHHLRLVTTDDGATKIYSISTDRLTSNVHLGYTRGWGDDMPEHAIGASVAGCGINLDEHLQQVLEARTAQDLFIGIARTQNIILQKEN